MHPTTFLALIPFIASLAASASTPFTSFAIRSGSPIHFIGLEARKEGIYIGGKTQSYCPSEQVPSCPPGNETAFTVGGGRASMDVEVPGGQLLYVAPDGALGYTVAHSSSYPQGSYLSGFKKMTNPDGNGINYWTFTGGNATGFLACPVKKNGSYKVYADVTGFKQKKCLGFAAQAGDYNGTAAWEYS